MSVDLEIEQPSTPSQSDDDGGGQRYIWRLLAGPGVSLILMAIVSLATWTGAQANNVDPFILQAPLTEDWWQLPLSVFSHQGMGHLSGNATAVAIFGSIVVISSSPVRYHLFFVATGIASGAAHIMATDALGQASAVLGASGAAMGLFAYVIVANDVSDWLLEHVSWKGVVVLVAGLVLGLTLWSASAQAANTGHLTGALLGAIAGYFHLLRSG